MIKNLAARALLGVVYRNRSLSTNARQLSAAVAAIQNLVATTPEPILRGRLPVPPMPGISPVMQDWSAFMTIEHVNGTNEALLALIPELEAGRQADIGDIRRFDYPDDCGPEVMPRFRELAARIVGLPQTYPLTGRGTFLHPYFGRLMPCWLSTCGCTSRRFAAASR